MKKILLAFESFHYSYDVVSLAIEMAKKDQASLQLVFIKPLHADEAYQYPFPNDLELADEGRESKETEDLKLINADVKIFRDTCHAAGVSYNVIADRELTVQELLDRSAFSDIIMAHASHDMGRYSIHELLGETHCPVVLVPNDFKSIDNIVLAYDGSPSSMIAIKMFSLLFNSWKDKSITLLNVKSKDSSAPDQDHLLREWLPLHYPQVKIQLPTGDVRQKMVESIKQLEGNTMVVMGAFGRKGFSKLLRRSLSYSVLEQTDAALFIIHE